MKPKNVTPDAVSKGVVPSGAQTINVSAVTNDANDWIVLPRIDTVESGHEITINCSAGTDFEMRTPASSNTKINNRDSDGSTYEYLCTDTEVIKVIKIDNTIGWMAHAYSALGEEVAAVVPHAV